MNTDAAYVEERCKQCRWRRTCFSILNTHSLAQRKRRLFCKRSNWFEWEDRLAKYDFAEEAGGEIMQQTADELAKKKAKYYQENHDDIRTQQARYYKDNKQAIRARRRERYRQHRIEILERRRQRYATRST